MKRLTFKCWHCNRTYSLLRDLTGSPKLNVACPYCEKAGIADLNPHQNNEVDIHKQPDLDKKPPDLNLPKIIPTTAPEGEA